MRSKILLSILVIIAVSAGCIGQVVPQQEVKTLQLDGVEYTFTHDINQTIKFPIESSSVIKARLYTATEVLVVFNGNSASDNSAIAVAGYNLVEKLKTYYIYSQGRFVKISGSEMNETSSSFTGQKILFLGPNSGADKNLIDLLPDGTIRVEGIDYGNLTLASDRLALLVLLR